MEMMGPPENQNPLEPLTVKFTRKSTEICRKIMYNQPESTEVKPGNLQSAVYSANFKDVIYSI